MIRPLLGAEIFVTRAIINHSRNKEEAINHGGGSDLVISLIRTALDAPENRPARAAAATDEIN